MQLHAELGLRCRLVPVLDYSMMNKLTDTDDATFFEYVVRAVEAISTIGAEETLGACQRILADDVKPQAP